VTSTFIFVGLTGLQLDELQRRLLLHLRGFGTRSWCDWMGCNLAGRDLMLKGSINGKLARQAQRHNFRMDIFPAE